MRQRMWHFMKNLFTARRVEKKQSQKKFNPWKRINSENMTDIEKMNKGFNGKTYSINGIDVDF